MIAAIEVGEVHCLRLSPISFALAVSNNVNDSSGSHSHDRIAIADSAAGDRC